MCSTSSTTTSARRASRRSRRSAPTSPTSTRRRGAGRSTSTTSTRDPVREWVLQSAEGWVRDFHVDGLRLDAIHAIVDSNPEHLVAGGRAPRARGPARRARDRRERAERPARDARRRDRGGYACDAAWADDFHHALRVLLTGDREGYYEEFGDVAAAREGVPPAARARRRSTRPSASAASARPPTTCRPSGSWSSPRTTTRSATAPTATGCRAEARPLAAFCTLLSPFTPMLFMGEEYGERAPFQFFSDHIDEEIATATREGRRREFAAFARVRRGDPGPAVARRRSRPPSSRASATPSWRGCTSA